LSYKLQIFVDFYNDLDSITQYITKTLQNPRAATRLSDDAEAACYSLVDFPEAHRLYQPPHPMKHEYRVISVRNYNIFYTVENETIKVRHIIYAKRDAGALLK
jgi:plasmid stabilization system protein ParE